MTACRTLFVCLMAVALLGVLAVPGFGQSKTAQSGMLTIDSPASAAFVIEGTDVYKYDRDCAGTRLSCTKRVKTWLGTEAVPNTTCTGAFTSSVDTADLPSVNAMINANKCNFFAGGPLVDTQSGIQVACSPQNLVADPPPPNNESSKRTDIECTIDSSGLVGYSAGPPAVTPTCWTLTSTVGDLPTITPSGRVAGESALCQSSPNRLKYAFTIQDPLAANGTRVSLLTGTLTNLDTSVVVETWSESLTNLSVAMQSVGTDFTYEGKNGANYGQGNPANLGLLTSKGPLTTPVARLVSRRALLPSKLEAWQPAPPPGACLTYDNFAGNNTASGLELVGYTALSASPGLSASTLGYQLTFTGVIKSSVSGQADLPISVTAVIDVDFGGCTP